MSKIEILFFVSWLVCGFSVDAMLDDKRAFVVVLIALIVAFVSGLRLIREGLTE